MSRHFPVHESDGTSQQARLAGALAPDYFRPDELRFEDLAAMSVRLSAALDYYGLDNRKDGNWLALLAHDETATLATILSTDVRRLEAAFLASSENRLEPRALGAWVLAETLDDWYRRLHRGESGPRFAIAERLGGIIRGRLAADLHGVGDLLLRLGRTPETSVDEGVPAATAAVLLLEDPAALFAHPFAPGRFDPVWGFGASPALFPHSGLEADADRTQQATTVRAAFFEALHAVAHLQDIVRPAFEASLRSADHEPAASLVLAFLKLLNGAQRELNTFTDRHQAFYHERCLGVGERPAQPRSAFLLLEHEAGTAPVRIARDTAFTAGSGADFAERVYRADHDVTLSDTRVARLRTLHLARDPLISPEGEFGYATRIKVAPPASEAEPDAGAAEPGALFGAGRKGEQAGDAAVGFALASHVLALREGHRTVRLYVNLEPGEPPPGTVGEGDERGLQRAFGRLFALRMFGLPGAQALHDRLCAIPGLQATLRALLDDLLAATRRDLVFYTRLEELFTLRLSGASGWCCPAAYVLHPGGRRVDGSACPGLSFEFTLEHDVEPIVACDPQVHGGHWQTRLPVMRLELDSTSRLFGYSLFEAARVAEMVVDVAVRGARAVRLYNDYGELEPGKPFTPFGPLPAVGSSFIVGSREAAGKRLGALALNVDWGGQPPRERGGFAAHYEGYGQDFDREAFEAGVEILNDGRWTGNPGARRVKLFPGGVAEPAHTVRIDIDEPERARTLAPDVAAAQFDYQRGARNGFVKLTLAAPPAAFGHALYQEVLVATVQRNARLRARRQKPLPKTPYTPTIERLSLDYEAQARIDFERDHARQDSLEYRDAVFHIHPFGIERVYPSEGVSHRALLPRYDHDGNLFIGLAGARPSGALTLYFDLGGDATLEAARRAPDVEWFYLTGGGWRRLAAARVLSDSTHGLHGSGIVILDLPPDIARGHATLPGEFYWLRVAAHEALERFPRLRGVHAHALQVSAEAGAPDLEAFDEAAPSETWSSLSPLPGLRALRQAGAFFGGRPPEGRTELRTRVSERLRHKQRASTPWDYERIVLEQFPDISKVKCFPATVYADPGRARPGHVLLVVVPRAPPACEAGAEVRVNSVELARIRDFVAARASRFISLEVRNPVYDRIQVRCAVRFVAGADSGLSRVRLQQSIDDYLSPWREPRTGAVFGWRLRREDLQTQVGGLDYVDAVAAISMLHVTRYGGELHQLRDTARLVFAERAPDGAVELTVTAGVVQPPASLCIVNPRTGEEVTASTVDGGLHARIEAAPTDALQYYVIDRFGEPGPRRALVAREAAEQVRPRYPWSLVLPLGPHGLEELAPADPGTARNSGIGRLRVGSTFIVGTHYHRQEPAP